MGSWVVGIVLCLVVIASGKTVDGDWENETPIIVGHRGAPAYRVEETLPSYELASNLHADFLETDLCITQDGVLICRHECNLDLTTDVSDHPEYADREKTVAGETGWFTEDFTLAEIRTLRTKERYDASVRTHAYDGLYQVITLDEFLQLASALQTNGSAPPSACSESIPVLGVYIETKTPSYFTSLGFDITAMLLQTLSNWGFEERCSVAKDSFPEDPAAWVNQCRVVLQSFENNLSTLQDCPYPLVQLLDDASVIQPDTGKTYGEMMTVEGLQELKQWAVGIGPWKESCLNYSSPNYESLGLVENAHSVGLLVHPYTFRPEAYFMNGAFNNDPIQEYFAFFDLGVDGVFTDSCDIAYDAVSEYYVEQTKTSWSLEIFFYILTPLLLGCFVLAIVFALVMYVRNKRAERIPIMIQPDTEASWA